MCGKLISYDWYLEGSITSAANVLQFLYEKLKPVFIASTLKKSLIEIL